MKEVLLCIYIHRDFIQSAKQNFNVNLHRMDTVNLPDSMTPRPSIRISILTSITIRIVRLKHAYQKLACLPDRQISGKYSPIKDYTLKDFQILGNTVLIYTMAIHYLKPKNLKSWFIIGSFLRSGGSTNRKCFLGICMYICSHFSRICVQLIAIFKLICFAKTPGSP